MATISENLLALNETKQAIKTAIENKGQDLTGVPFTDYANKISEIASGGKKFTTGTVTPTSHIKGYLTIQHNLGVKPSIFLFYTNNSPNDVHTKYFIFIDNGVYNGIPFPVFAGAWTGSSYSTTAVDREVTNNETDITITVYGKAYPFYSGVNYQWIAIE